MTYPHSLSYLPRDFIATRCGLVFAVMAHHLEGDKVLGFLRYLQKDGRFHKLHTEEANQYLAEQQPDYLFSSKRLDALLHGIPVADIHQHYKPRLALRELLTGVSHDPVIRAAQHLCRLLANNGLTPDQVGITGSLLLGAQGPNSDIDLVIYDRLAFFNARMAIEQLMARGEIQALAECDWQDAYTRRGCELSFEEYVRHERRKLNKGKIAGIKFDISLVTEGSLPFPDNATKAGYHRLQARVVNTDRSFDYPAIYRLDHPDISEAWSFIQTYAGQAFVGEWIEVRGLLETGSCGEQRIVVGSSREAPGEYIKTIRNPH